MIDISILEKELKSPEKSNYFRAKKSKNGFHDYPKDTFIFKNYEDNLIDSVKDKVLLSKLFRNKVESRMEYERSEDAVTWNVFRYLDKNNLLKKLILYITDGNDNSEVQNIVYWSSCISKDNKQVSVYDKLTKAREKFREIGRFQTEPDIIIETEIGLYVIEAKFNSPNKSIISDKNGTKKERYSINGEYKELFDLIISKGYYELLREWVLGNYMAENSGKKKFYLLNLVRMNREKDIESKIGDYLNNIKSNIATRKFKRITWEDIYKNIILPTEDKEISYYFHNKTIGYSIRNGEISLKYAFNVD